MNVRDLIPWGRGNNQTPTFYRNGDLQQLPLLSLHREMNRLFDDVFRDFDAGFPAFGQLASSRVWPNVEISEADKEIRITAEIPGLDEKDVEVVLENDVLTLRGEKRSEIEDNERRFSERYYGRFERRIPLGSEIEQDKVQASFKNGVLTVTLPKTAKDQSKIKRIAINS